MAYRNIKQVQKNLCLQFTIFLIMLTNNVSQKPMTFKNQEVFKKIEIFMRTASRINRCHRHALAFRSRSHRLEIHS